MTYKYFLGLGSNIEPRMDFLSKAVQELALHGDLIQKSGIYLTQPWGKSDQNDYYNAVIEYHCSLPPQNLMVLIKTIETHLGRKKTSQWGPREIDIDILICQGIKLTQEDLQIPHKYMYKRRFVLEPLKELYSNILQNELYKSLTEHLTECDDDSTIQRLNITW